MKKFKAPISIALAAVMALSSASVGMTAFAAQDPDRAPYKVMTEGSTSIRTTLTIDETKENPNDQINENSQSSWYIFTPASTSWYRFAATTTPIYKGYDPKQTGNKRSEVTYSTSKSALVKNTSGTNIAVDETNDRVDTFKLELANNQFSTPITNGSVNIDINKSNSWGSVTSTYPTKAVFNTSTGNVVADTSSGTQGKFVDRSTSYSYALLEANKTYYLKATQFVPTYDTTSAYAKQVTTQDGKTYKVKQQALLPETTLTVSKANWAVENGYPQVVAKDVKVEVPSWYTGTFKDTLRKEADGKYYVTASGLAKEPQTSISYSGTNHNVIVPETYEGYVVRKVAGCENKAITSLTVPGSVQTIADNTFANCTLLNTVTLGEGVERIGDNAFYNTALKSIVLPKSMVSIGTNSFANTLITNVTIKNKDMVGFTNAGFGKFRAANGANAYTDKTKVKVVCDANTLVAREAAMDGFNVVNNCEGKHTYNVKTPATYFMSGKKACIACGAEVVIPKLQFKAATVKALKKKRVYVKAPKIGQTKYGIWVSTSKNFTKNTTKKYVVKSNKALAKKIAVKKAGKYYVKVKAYKGSAKTNSYTRVVRVK